MKIGDDGLFVEFLWGYLQVDWSNIESIKHVGFGEFAIWVITIKKGLTFFHRLYSLAVFKSFLPSFYIHTSQSAEHAAALKIIKTMGTNR